MTGDEHPKTASICGGVAGVRCTNGMVETVGIPKHKIHIRRVMSLSSACSCDATSCFSTRVSTMHLVCQPLLASARDAARDAAMLGLDSTSMHLMCHPLPCTPCHASTCMRRGPRSQEGRPAQEASAETHLPRSVSGPSYHRFCLCFVSSMQSVLSLPVCHMCSMQ